MVRIVRFLETIGALLLFAMMTVTFVDVVGRYIVGRPLTGSTEIIQVLLAMSVVCILPSITWRGEHISIGLFEAAAPTTVERTRRAAVGLLGALTFAALGWLLWWHAVEAGRNGDVIGYLRLPVAPMIHAMAALSGVTALVFGVLAASSARGRVSREAAHIASPASPIERLS